MNDPKGYLEPPPGAASSCFDWPQARRRLESASDLSRIAAPPQLDTRGPRRWLQMLLAKVVLRLTRFITSRQTDCNVCLSEAARDVAEGLHEVEKQVVENQERIRQLEARLAQLQRRTGCGMGQPQRSAG
jgi:hypothetical protein